MSDSVETIQRVALVTGGSRGIGAACCEAMAKAGYAVIVNHSGEHSAPVAAELAANLAATYGVEAVAMQADVSSSDEVKQMVADIKERFGRIDVLVNNAGVTRDGLIARMKEEDFDRVIDVNLKGAFNCIRHCSSLMIKQRYGRIVSLSSVVGVAGNAGQANYAASKAGIIGLTKSVAKELGARGITANAVAPGFIETDMTAALGNKADAVLDRITAGRFGQADEVAAAVAFLASEQAGYITGQVLAIDGGMAI